MKSSRNLRLTAPKWIKSWSKFANSRFNIAGYQTQGRRTRKMSYRMQSG